MNFSNRILIVSALVVSACGGSSNTVDPFSNAGFATRTTKLSQAYDFTFKDLVRTKTKKDSAADILTQESADTIRIIGTTGTGPIVVELDGKTYSLTRNSTRAQSAEYRNGSDSVLLIPLIEGNDYSTAVSLFAVINGKLDSGAFVLGYDTDPSKVSRTSGQVVYNGGMNVALRNGFLDAFGQGDVRLTVDFDDGDISGSGRLVERPQFSEFSFEPVDINFDKARISGNAFTGSISVAPGALDGTLADAEYGGRFFGPDIESVGGQFTGRIQIDGNAQDTFVDGVFLATK